MPESPQTPLHFRFVKFISIIVEAVPRMSTFDHRWYRTARSDCQQWTEMGEAVPSSGVMINSRGEWLTKTLEGTETLQQTPNTIRSEKPEGTDTVYTNSHMRLVEFFHVALEDPMATGVGLWLKLILLIITIELIWFWSTTF